MICCVSQRKFIVTPPQKASDLVEKPIVRVNGNPVHNKVQANGTDIISVSVNEGESLYLSRFYIIGQPRYTTDIREGLITKEQSQNINTGGFAKAPAGTVWIVSFYAEKGGMRSETEVVVFIRD